MQGLPCRPRLQHQGNEGVVGVAVGGGPAPVQHLVEEAHAAFSQGCSHFGRAGLSCCLEQGCQCVVEGEGVGYNGHL